MVFHIYRAALYSAPELHSIRPTFMASGELKGNRYWLKKPILEGGTYRTDVEPVAPSAQGYR